MNTKESIIDNIDILKFVVVFQDSIQKLKFLGNLFVEPDANSELAEHEITKLLGEQVKLEKQYEELIKKRSTLTGIVNLEEFQKCEKQIQDIAKNLKDSTKKLCRLFKENPDLEADSKKVVQDREYLITKLEELLEAIKLDSYEEIKQNIIDELKQQDSLRKEIEKEKNLHKELKNLREKNNQEQLEYEKEMKVKFENIKNLKKQLMEFTNDAVLVKKQFKKSAQAEKGKIERIYKNKEQDLENEIKFLEQKIEIEKKVFLELKSYHEQAISEFQKLSSEINEKMFHEKEALENAKDELTQKINEGQEKLDEDRKKKEVEEFKKNKKIEEEIKKEKEKQENKINQQKKENAIKFFQMDYVDWIAKGGGGKKKKKKKAKAK